MSEALQAGVVSGQVAENVRTLRERNGWTQQHVADLASELETGWSVDAGLVGRLERGERSIDVDELCALAQIFAVGTGRLMFDPPDSFDPGVDAPTAPAGDR